MTRFRPTRTERLTERAETYWHRWVLCRLGRHRVKFGSHGHCIWCDEKPECPRSTARRRRQRGDMFFGERWDAPIVDEATQVPTPVGQRCSTGCGELIGDGDRGFLRAVVRVVDGVTVASVEPIHAECDLRAIMGHQVGVCPCHGYGLDRAAARLVWGRVGEMRGRDLADRA